MKASCVKRMGTSVSTRAMLPAIALIAFSAAPSAAQIPDDVVLNIIRECARIDDPTARLACYDNNIRAGGFDGRAPSVPGQDGRISGGGSPSGRDSGYGPQGFGSDSVRTPERFQSHEDRGYGPDAITARIQSVRQREPGIYLITLEGGAEWLFTDAAPRSFRAPSRGDNVDISRAALGSFLMRFDGQQSHRVRRIK